MRKSAILILASAVLACGFANAARADDMVENPAYKMWARYKPGTTVTMKTSNEMTGIPNMPAGMGKNESTQVRTLDSIDADKAVVTTKIEGGGGMMAGRGPGAGAGKIEIPARIDKAKLDSAMAPADAKVTNVKEGADKVEVGGKSMDVKTREMDIEMTVGGQARKSHQKMWISEEVPGGVVKMTIESDMTIRGAAAHMNMTSTMEKFEAAK